MTKLKKKKRKGNNMSFMVIVMIIKALVMVALSTLINVFGKVKVETEMVKVKDI